MRIASKIIFLFVGLSLYIPIAFSQSNDMPFDFVSLFNTDIRSEVNCFRIPAVAVAADGTIIVAADERVPSCGDLRHSRDINIVLRKSHDNGLSWSNIETIIDFPLGSSASDPSFVVDKLGGTIFLFYNFMDLDNEKHIYYLHYIKSTDNGNTWSSPVDITSSISLPDWHADFKFISSGNGTQTKSGTLLHTLVNLQRGLFVFGSDDGGENWYLIETPVKPADESKIVELANGSWMINSRVNGAGMRYLHTSMDKGLSWESTAAPELIDPSCNADFLHHYIEKDGNKIPVLLFANAKSVDKRENLSFSISLDGGQTWPLQKTIYPGEAAYSSFSVLDNGDIALVFEKDDYRDIVFARIPIDWLLEAD